MDAISDNVFTDIGTNEVPVDDPSLLTVILDLSAQGWYNIKDQITLQEVTKSLLVFLNAHLSLNNSNQVAFVASSPMGSKFLYPNPAKDANKKTFRKESSPSLVSKNMYRQFRLVDEAVLEELNEYIEETSTSSSAGNSTLSGALSMVLTYTNRMFNLDQSISTTTASAISSTTNAATLGRSSNNSSSNSSNHKSSHITSMKSRILIVTASDDIDVNYIPIMNTIFAAQKMGLSIDVVKLGLKNSAYLQQACDTTSGIYLHIQNPQGLIQVLCTAYFVEPSIRNLIILPTNANTNYRASCFITGKSVDMGYVCSVCLCIMSVIPELDLCPVCASNFDKKIIEQLSRGPVVAPRKKRKVETGAAADSPTPQPV